MIVMNPLNGLGATLPLNSGQVHAQQVYDVHALNRLASGARLAVTRRGMGAGLASVPTWVWAVGGGLAVGLVGGAIYFRRKRRR